MNVSPGGGGGGSPDIANGQFGGSGGGGASGSTTTAGSAYSGRGNAGGAGNDTGSESGGGGGGAGAVGTAGTDGVGGNGGNGTASSISGTSVTYAGGGGGGSNGVSGSGGSGGGGIGTSGPDLSLSNGTNGLGGGGGGNFGAFAGGDGGSGVVIISYPTGSMFATGGMKTTDGSGNTVHIFLVSDTFVVQSISASNNYYVSSRIGNRVTLSPSFDPYATNTIPHGTTGTATYSTVATIASGVAKSVEGYNTATTTYTRYYILDSNSRIWVYDEQVYAANGTQWMLPSIDTTYTNFTGISIINGWLFAINNVSVYAKPTVDLGRAFGPVKKNGSPILINNPLSARIHPCFSGTQGKLYWGDGNYLGSLFPSTSLATGFANVQSYMAVKRRDTSILTSTVETVASVNGSIPIVYNASSGVSRLPVVFIQTDGVQLPLQITEGVVYWAQVNTLNTNYIALYTAQTGGSPIQFSDPYPTTVTLYFNSFYPLGDQQDTTASDVNIFSVSAQRLNLPSYEIIQCMGEIGNTLMVGTASNKIYPWDQVSALPSNAVELPESDITAIININNAALVFAGKKGNIYIANTGSTSSLLKIPDYSAGIAGQKSTYVEPVFQWGDAAYIRGRVYCSIKDQTATKAGNAGGVWSFIPPQNYTTDYNSMSLRLENQNSYGSYNGYATLIIPRTSQAIIGTQYFSAWDDGYDITHSSFGIDTSSTNPVTTFLIETDLIPIGTLLNKRTFQQLEYKLSTALASGESATAYWRVNATDAWQPLSNDDFEIGNQIAGFGEPNFQTAQWVQLQYVFTTTGDASTSSFVRITELRMR